MTTISNVTMGLPLPESMENATCVSRNKLSFLAFAVIPSVPIVFNVAVLIAVGKNNRNLMRQSRVYAHVSSTLVANVIFSTLAFIQILSLYFNFEGYNNRLGHQGEVREDMLKLWAFRKAFLYGMYIVMCGNIGFLIEVIRSRISKTLWSTAGPVRNQHGNRTSSSSYRSNGHSTVVPNRRMAGRRYSYIAIALLWIASLLYVLIPTLGWSCVKDCICLSSCFPRSKINNPPVAGCSRAFPPMSNSWIGVTIGMWAIGLGGALIHLKRSITSLNKAFLEHASRQSHEVVNDDPESDDTAGYAIECSNTGQQISHSTCHSPTKDASPSNDEDCNTKRMATTKCLLFFRSCQFRGSNDAGLHLKPATQFKHVVSLTVTYAICTAPPMLYLVADMALPKMEMNMVLMNVCLLFPFIYCVICPILLIKCLPGMKKSVRHLLLSVCKCSSSEISRQTIR